MICGECLREIHPQSPIDYMGTSVRHKHRQDCLYAIKEQFAEATRARDQLVGQLKIILLAAENMVARFHGATDLSILAYEELKTVITAERK